MKYMKLGSKQDTFQTLGNIRSVASEIASDFTVVVEGVTFHLHKFPLLSKSAKLQRLAAEAKGSGNFVEIWKFPGGLEAFELCAKFCYGISITLNAFNAVGVRCAAEYLGMTEAVEKGNLICKMDIFLQSSIVRGWKDTIIALKKTKMFLPLSEELNLVNNFIDALAIKTLVDPEKVDWSFAYTNADVKDTKLEKECGVQSRKHQRVPKDWWIEDLAELEIDLYWRIMIVIKSNGKTPNTLIGEALRFYAFKWLQGLPTGQTLADPRGSNTRLPTIDYMEVSTKHRMVLEKIVSLLPLERGSVSCSFLLGLLKAGNILGISSSLKLELTRRVGLQLEEACVNDLLIPSPCDDALYDIDLVISIVEHFMMQDGQTPPTSPSRARIKHEKRRAQSTERIEFTESRRRSTSTVIHSSKLLVAKLIDGYLAEVARDPQLDVPKFIGLAEYVPDFARPVHDGLYKAIDAYLKERPGLSKAERRKVCSLLDCKKLSMDACMHAAQNEKLPLRVVVQVLFFEQVRAAMTGGLLPHDLPTSVQALIMSSQEGTVNSTQEGTCNNAQEDGWESVHQKFRSIKDDLANLRRRISEAEKGQTTDIQPVSKSKGIFNVPSMPKKILGKLWPPKNFSETAKSCGSRLSTRLLQLIPKTLAVTQGKQGSRMSRRLLQLSSKSAPDSIKK